MALAGAAGLIYQTQAADQPQDAPKGAPARITPDEKTSAKEPGVLSPEEAIKQKDKEKVTVQFKVASVKVIPSYRDEFGPDPIALKDGKNFSARLMGPALFQAKRLGLEPAKHFGDKIIRVTGRVQPDSDGGSAFHIAVNDLNQIEIVTPGNTAAKKEQPAKTDQERIVGWWTIVNADSGRKGEEWIINKDDIFTNPNFYGYALPLPYRLDASKTPKQFDFGRPDNPASIKGIYVLDGDELRLCLGAPGKDRPTAFPEKPKRGEVLILQRGLLAGQRDKFDRQRMVGNWFITNADSQRKGEMWVITEDSILMHAKSLGLNYNCYAHRLDASKNPKQIDITVSRIKGKDLGVIKGIYVLDGDELRLCLGAMDKDRPAAFPEKPKPGEVLVLHSKQLGRHAADHEER